MIEIKAVDVNEKMKDVMIKAKDIRNAVNGYRENMHKYKEKGGKLLMAEVKGEEETGEKGYKTEEIKVPRKEQTRYFFSTQKWEKCFEMTAEDILKKQAKIAGKKKIEQEEMREYIEMNIIRRYIRDVLDDIKENRENEKVAKIKAENYGKTIAIINYISGGKNDKKRSV